MGSVVGNEMKWTDFLAFCLVLTIALAPASQLPDGYEMMYFHLGKTADKFRTTN